MGLASAACYLSLHLGVRLPHDVLFLGEVECRGGLNYPSPINKLYLDLCVENGFSRIVGMSTKLEALQDEIKKDRYKGIQLIGLDNALDLLPQLFHPLKLERENAH